MIKDYIIIDDVLDDPDELIELSRNISFYTKEKTGIDGITTKQMRIGPEFSESKWRGFRSDFLHEIDQEIFEKVFNNIMKKMLKTMPESVLFRYSVQSHLHFSPGLVPFYEGWWHQDPACLFAGVVYLTKNPEPDSGTILRLDDGEMIAENKFNRLVLYRSNIVHRPQKCFGDSVDNSRFSLTMFFKEFCLKA